jgi:hypothetical protein
MRIKTTFILWLSILVLGKNNLKWFINYIVYAADKTDYYNKYTCTDDTYTTKIEGVNDATYSTTDGIDTTLYLG